MLRRSIAFRGVVRAASARCPQALPFGVFQPLRGTVHGVTVPIAAASLRFQASAERMHKCSACGKTFRLANALTHHINTKHGGEGKAIVVGADGKPLSVADDASKPAKEEPKATPVAAAVPPATPTATVAATTGAAAPTTEAPAAERQATDEDVERKMFVCAVCQKGFRLEAALAHHYQAKHNMDMPVAAPTPTAAAAGADGTAAVAATPAMPTPTAPGASGHNYVHSSEAVVPQPPQYHLDVAPNAPEESEIAAHARCVNHMMIVGAAQDVQTGFVFEDNVVQFVVATDFDSPAPGEPDRDFHTIRVFGNAFGKQIASALAGAGGGARVLVSGRLRMVPQYEQATSKYYHFPVVQVHEGSGFVRLL
jgi:hypothetical protein